LIIAAPGGAKGAVSKRVVELVDLHATLADLCGLKVPPKLDGVSMKALVENPSAPWDRPAITQVTRGGGAGGAKRIMGYTVRTDRWRYTEWDGGRAGAELYDHDADPGELTNLAKDAGRAAVITKMKRILDGAIGRGNPTVSLQTR
jgi:iduronate 2-sulfatase